jgi:ubiquinone/menaquinone biosynthesis C-methylase UbiE
MNSLDEQMKLADAGSYDPLAGTFDRFTTLCGKPLALRMLALAGVEPSRRLLDVGTGTGLVALQAASRIGQGGQVLGIDLSEGMLEVARAKAASAGLTSRLEFRLMDAEALELEDRSFDVVVSLFALYHFPNPLLALQEMYRVLRPEGRIVIGVGSGAPLFSWCGLVHGFQCLPELWHRLRGRRLTAPSFLNTLVETHFPSAHRTEVPEWITHTRHKKYRVRALLREAGFKNLRTFWMGHQVYFEDPREFWELQVTFSSIARKRLARVPQEKLAALRSEFLQTCATVQARGGKLAYPSGAFYVRGEKP